MRLHDPGFGTLVVHASTPRPGADRPVLLWHHGSPQTGAIIPPVADAASTAGMDAVSVARPAYGGSERRTGRDVRSVASDLERVLDLLGVDRVVSVGASGGGPHALACAAVMPARVSRVVTFASLAPFRDDDAWFAGMVDPGGLRAAADGIAARVAHLETEEFDPASFIEADYRALETSWRALGQDVAASEKWGSWGLVDDDVAFTRAWGFALSEVLAPVTIVHGDADRVVPFHHGEALVAALPEAALDRIRDGGHISVLDGLEKALAGAIKE